MRVSTAKLVMLATVLTAFAPSLAQATPLSLANAILNQDPAIAQLVQLPITQLSNSPEADPGFGPKLRLVRTRMSEHWGVSKTASPEELEKAGQKALPQVLNELRSRGVSANIKTVAALYGIDPVHLLGPIATEGVFNAASLNAIQDFSGRLMEAAGCNVFARQVLNDPNVRNCRRLANAYLRWNCIAEKEGSHIYLVSGHVHNPLLQTYGLGQFSPFRAIMNTEMLQRVSNFTPITDDDVGGAFAITLDETKTLHAMAANTVMIIAAYERIAGFDLTKRPDLTATLYNLGGEVDRARSIRTKLDQGTQLKPANNYFGHFVHENLETLRSALR